MLVIFWNRPRAELVGLAAAGFQLDSLAISWERASHSGPEPQPNRAATPRPASTTSGEPAIPPPPLKMEVNISESLVFSAPITLGTILNGICMAASLIGDPAPGIPVSVNRLLNRLSTFEPKMDHREAIIPPPPPPSTNCPATCGSDIWPLNMLL